MGEKKHWSQNLQTINIDDAFCVSFEFPGKTGQNVNISYQIILPLSPLITSTHSHRMHLYYIIQVSMRYTAYMYSRCAIIMFGFYSVKHSKQKAKRTWERLNYLFYRMCWANCVFLFIFLFSNFRFKSFFFLARTEMVNHRFYHLSSVSNGNRWNDFKFFLFFSPFQDFGASEESRKQNARLPVNKNIIFECGN